ncbi:MAG: glycoside hydrolase family 78 protein, partial [Armatimonadetes bacterium]|nr:glycoside hydrolase family 78 protein [Armatimonadota bacterium]
DVLYAGQPLAARQRAYWNVTVTDEAGGAGTSESAFWEVGLLTTDDWQGAEWISGTLTGGARTSVPAPYLRTVFTLDAVPESASLYISALGLYDVTINGVRVGESVFAPGWTDYNKRVQYQAFDVTPLLRAGENVLGAVLGDGWYCGHVGGGARQTYGEKPALLATLFAGDTVITTSGEWQAATGAVLESDMLMGESHDARREPVGWDKPGFDASRWQSVEIVADPGIERSPMLAEPVRAFEEMTAIAEPQAIPGWPQPTYIYDFGQNLVGYCRLQITGEAGTTVRLRYAECLEGGPAATTGKLYTANLRGARCTDYYTLRGDPEGETWTPRFTFHGFRFAELNIFPPSHPTTESTGTKVVPGRDALTAIVLNSDTPQTGDFECSDPLLNQLQRNIDWGQRGNFLEVPTDCPQRDERLGWTGDAQAFIRTAAWNRDVQSFFHKWQRDLADAQSETGKIPSVIPNPDPGSGDGGPAWADAVVICPWTVYLAYGDKAILSEHYDSLALFVRSLEDNSQDDIRSYEGMPGHRGFGDWLAQDGTNKVDGGTPKDLIGTAFRAYDATLMAKIARVLGKTEDAAIYDALFERIRDRFVRRYVTPDGMVYPGTQTAYCLALHFGLLPEALRQTATDALVADIKSRGHKLTTGFVGSPYLPHVLSDNGRPDIAYKLLHQKNWPSYLYAVTQGATTIWERWDGWTHDKGFQDAGMNSFNHYAYGAIGDWMYQRVAGINLDEARPGYKHIVLKPLPFGSGLTFAKAHLETVYGRVESAWELEGDALMWNVTVPPNTTATAHFPAEVNAQTVTEGGKPLTESDGVTVDGEGGVLQLAPGSYRFAATTG